jgi:hypothetical protein
VYDAGIDLSLRVGTRFYVGAGGFVRLWRVFDRDRGFEGGGGGLVDFGWLLLDDRPLDIFLRALVGAHRSSVDGSTQLMGGGAAGIGWSF